ncbi:hypothetical protein HJG60_009950 [Phyllostomus discolor]|uniref:Uncharacterized protein n=1 Tax=Phyllostomus discolor TaxID=89673 RepID=A0A834BA09_9CHIR|nr:hypothetical protein HJG60_009950 [Phyllostomus discolor]
MCRGSAGAPLPTEERTRGRSGQVDGNDLLWESLRCHRSSRLTASHARVPGTHLTQPPPGRERAPTPCPPCTYPANLSVIVAEALLQISAPFRMASPEGLFFTRPPEEGARARETEHSNSAC